MSPHRLCVTSLGLGVTSLLLGCSSSTPSAPTSQLPPPQEIQPSYEEAIQPVAELPPPAESLDPRIHVTSPQPSEEISSPLIIHGEARGTWYFEATFPVILVDWDGLIIAQSYAQAEGEWMIEHFVPFSATITFETPPYNPRGILILQKSNPSGLPEHDAAIEVPIRFSPPLPNPPPEGEGKPKG